jgi:hypothetical protein
MIENIENTDLFLFNGAVVKREDLMERTNQLRDIVAQNELFISNMNLIDCSMLQGDLLEAATMYNATKQTEIDKLQGEIDHFTVEISNIEKWL